VHLLIIIDKILLKKFRPKPSVAIVVVVVVVYKIISCSIHNNNIYLYNIDPRSRPSVTGYPFWWYYMLTVVYSTVHQSSNPAPFVISGSAQHVQRRRFGNYIFFTLLLITYCISRYLPIIPIAKTSKHHCTQSIYTVLELEGGELFSTYLFCFKNILVYPYWLYPNRKEFWIFGYKQTF